MKLTYVFMALVAAAYVEENFMVDAAMTQAARDAMLDDHNELRANVFADTGYYATNMLVMTYDTDLEASAQVVADTCVFQHSVRTDRGENLHAAWPVTSEPTTAQIVAASEAWHAEKEDFNFGGTDTGVTGHYTQQMWHDSDKLGCAWTKCSTLETSGGPENDALYVVCHYKKQGNYNGQLPFMSGANAAACIGTDSTYTNLCTAVNPCVGALDTPNKGCGNYASLCADPIHPYMALYCVKTCCDGGYL